MRKMLLLTAALILGLAAGSKAVDFGFGLQVDDEGRKSFYLAVSNHYNVPEKEIVVVRERRVPDEEMPVVFFLARKAGVAPKVIIDLRLSGKSWMDITIHYGLNAKVYYVEFEGDPGPPYGHAYGHFKKRPKDKWGEIRLSDGDIVNFVNLRFISDHYGWSANDVIKMRQNGKDFVYINQDVKNQKAGKNKQAGADNKSGKDNGKGNGKNKGNGKKN